VVTGTEVLTGRVSDRNGPWLAERLCELGVDVAYTTIVGDRPGDMDAALRFMAGEDLELILTSGGLGPTADDLTAEVVGSFQGREMVLDEALEARIAEIVKPLMKRWPNLDPGGDPAGNRKQATIPAGATVLEPVGTAPGLVVPPREPDRDNPDGRGAAGPAARAAADVGGGGEDGGAAERDQRRDRVQAAMLRLFGIPESEIAETLRVAEREGVELSRLEITTCLKRGEVEVVTRYEPAEQEVYDAFEAVVRKRHADTLFSDDGSTVDDQVAALLRGRAVGGDRARTIATAESCTGGLLAARLTELPGSSDYVKGGIVAYSNEAKVAGIAGPGGGTRRSPSASCG
jgi:nicotinamide-nucleotide amidase